MSAGPPCRQTDNSSNPARSERSFSRRSSAHPSLRRTGSGNGPAIVQRRRTVEPTPERISAERRELLAAAVELGVDLEDIDFRSAEERRLWYALEQEFAAFVAKVGPVWIADECDPVGP